MEFHCRRQLFQHAEKQCRSQQPDVDIVVKRFRAELRSISAGIQILSPLSSATRAPPEPARILRSWPQPSPGRTPQRRW